MVVLAGAGLHVLTRLVPLEDAVGVAAGRRLSCALMSDGSVRCWGGMGKTSNLDEPKLRVRRRARYPRAVEGVANAVEVVTDGARSCARTDAGRATCWGFTPDLTPPRELQTDDLLRAEDLGLAGVTAIAVGPQVCVAVHGRATCSSERDPEALDTEVVLPSERTATRLAVTDGEGCAVLDDATLACWPLQDGGMSVQHVEPVPVAASVASSLSGVDDVALSSGAGCTVDTDGAVSCWTDRTGGTDAAVAVPVDGRVIDLDGGVDDRFCAALADGRLTCWELVVSDIVEVALIAPRPQVVGGIDDAVAVAIGAQHTCAAGGDGRVRCWGRNSHGQTGWGGGIPDAPSEVDDPVTVVVSGYRRRFLT